MLFRSDFFDIEKELVDLLVKSLNVQLDRAQKRAVGQKATQSFDAVAAYAQGLDARDAGDQAKAAAAFQTALAADPEYRAAQDAAGRIRAMLKVEEKGAADALDEIEARATQPGFADWLWAILQRAGGGAPQVPVYIRIARFLLTHKVSPPPILTS